MKSISTNQAQFRGIKQVNSNNMLSFLKTVTVKENNVKRGGAGGPRKERNPIAADLRVFKTGAIYPSAALVEKYSLEYVQKDAEDQGNALDVVDSRLFINTASNDVPFLMVAAVSKKESKVDIFGQTTYEDDGTPKSSVLDQGTTSYGKDLLETLKEVYNVEITEESEQDYIDLVFVEAPELQEMLDNATKGVYYIPKAIKRGEKKGEVSTIRRKDLKFSVLLPLDMYKAELEATANKKSASIADRAAAADELQALSEGDNPVEEESALQGILDQE